MGAIGRLLFYKFAEGFLPIAEGGLQQVEPLLQAVHIDGVAARACVEGFDEHACAGVNLDARYCLVACDVECATHRIRVEADHLGAVGPHMVDGGYYAVGQFFLGTTAPHIAHIFVGPEVGG